MASSNGFIKKKRGVGSGLGRLLARAFPMEGSDRWFDYLLITSIAVLFGLVFAHQMLKEGIGMIAVVLGGCVVLACMLNAEVGLYINLIFCFFICYFARLVLGDYTFVGTLSDILILATLSGYIIRRISLKPTWRAFLSSRVVVWLLILDAYAAMQLYNPGAHSFYGWYLAFRKSLEVLLLFFIAYSVFDSYQKVRRYIIVLFVCCVIAALYGCFQQWHGLATFEKIWVMSDDTRFGLIFVGGDFRKFSTMSDPTAYGIIMGACALFFMILALAPQKVWRKRVLLAGVILMLLGMSYSGTRTANIMIVAGIGMYILLTANKRKTWVFAIISTIIFLGLLYVPIYSNPTLIRFRTSFMGKNDESFNTRELSRAMIQPYIRVHPFGGGLGTTGAMGLLYNPGHRLAGFQTDNGYLQSALEMGWIGLGIICLFFFFTLKAGISGYFESTEDRIKFIYAAIIVSLFSFIIAEFAQTAIGQISDEMVFYPLIAIILKLKYFDKSRSGEKA